MICMGGNLNEYLYGYTAADSATSFSGQMPNSSRGFVSDAKPSLVAIGQMGRVRGDHQHSV